MSNTESENIQLMGASLIVLSLALLYCWYQTNEQNGCNKQYITGPHANYNNFVEISEHVKGNMNSLHDMPTSRIIKPFTSNEYKSKANFTDTRRIVDGFITPNSEAVSSPVSLSVAIGGLTPMSSSSSVSSNILARKTSALKKNLSNSYSPFDDSTVIRNFNVSDVQTTHLNDMVNGMNTRQIAALECPLSTTSMVMSMSDFNPQCST
jgi:hypothetical protein